EVPAPVAGGASGRAPMTYPKDELLATRKRRDRPATSRASPGEEVFPMNHAAAEVRGGPDQGGADPQRDAERPAPPAAGHVPLRQQDDADRPRGRRGAGPA